MGVVDREFPEPGSADQYLEALKVQIAAAADKLKLMVGQEGGGGGGQEGRAHWCDCISVGSSFLTYSSSPCFFLSVIHPLLHRSRPRSSPARCRHTPCCRSVPVYCCSG